jgi:HD-like signal output (HDOD) protein
VGLWDRVTTWLAGQEQTRDSAQTVSYASAIDVDACAVAVLEAGETTSDATEQRWWSPPPGDLCEVPAPERPELSPEARALENLLIMHFDGRNLSLPSLPEVPERVLRLLGDPDRSLGQVAAEIGKDPVTAASVIRMSNSALYCGLSKMTSIQAAVVRLGANVIRTLMYNLSLRSVMFSERRSDAHFAEMLWRGALASGIAMRSLSRFTGVNAEEAFLIGLLHDVGNIIVLRITNGQQAVMKSKLDPETFVYLCHEAHQEFGELLADSWGLPNRLKSLIIDHHGHPAADDPYRVERLQLQVADSICALLDYTPYVPVNLVKSRAVTELKLTDQPEFLSFLEVLPAELELAVEEMS